MNEQEDTADQTAWWLLFASWLIALIASLGALFIGEVMGQEPCVLCWFQRAFVFPLAVILGVACYLSDPRVWRYALPLAAIGWLIAAYHVALFLGLAAEEIVPCGMGPSCSDTGRNWIGIVPIPVLSFAAMTGMLILFLLIRRRLALWPNVSL